MGHKTIIDARLRRMAMPCALAFMLVTLGIRSRSVAAGDSSPYVDASQVPRIYTKNPSLFIDLLVDTHASPRRIAHFGDSTSTDVVGAGGPHLSWRRWLWHEHFG